MNFYKKDLKTNFYIILYYYKFYDKIANIKIILRKYV